MASQSYLPYPLPTQGLDLRQDILVSWHLEAHKVHAKTLSIPSLQTLDSLSDQSTSVSLEEPTGSTCLSAIGHRCDDMSTILAVLTTKKPELSVRILFRYQQLEPERHHMDYIDLSNGIPLAKTVQSLQL